MLVSIIIPNYNKAPFIEATIKSVQSQTYPDWEAIVVDDGSTDGSTEIIQTLATQDPRIRFFQRTKAPKGGSVCRNIGIEKARGEYIMFFDSDDLMSPDCLKVRIVSIKQFPDIHFGIFPVGTFHHHIGDNKNVWNTKNGNHLIKFLRHDLPWNIMSPLWKTEFIKKHLKGFDESFPRLQDVEFHTRALMVPNVKYQIFNKTSPECYYRIDPNRSRKNYFQMLETMWPGVKIYIQKFIPLLDNKKYLNQLRGTLFAFLTQLNYFRATKKITHEQYQFFLSIIKDFINKKKCLFSDTDLEIIKHYNYWYQKGGWKIKGYNFLTKTLLIHK